MYVVTRIWQVKDTLEYDGMNVVGICYTKKAAMRLLQETIKFCQSIGYFLSDEYYPKPFDKDFEAEVWMKDSESIAIITIKEAEIVI